MSDVQLPDGADDPRELAAGYALGILTPQETARYEAFLAQNPEAQAEADTFGEVAAALSSSAPEVAPPPAMKADLMALIASTPQLPRDEPVQRDEPDQRHERALQDEAPTLRTVSPETPPPSAIGRAENRARTRWYARPAVYLSAAAAAAVIVIGGVTVPSLLAPDSGQTQQASELEQIRSAPDAREAAGALATGEKATLVWSSSLGRSALVVDDLAPLPDDKTYELWYIGSSGPVAAGTFEAGEGRTVAPLEGTFADGVVVAVTVEDEGGSPTPTTDPILAISTA